MDGWNRRNRMARKVGGGRHGLLGIGGLDGLTIFHGWKMDGG